MKAATTYNPITSRNRIHPHKFALYISFASIAMMFAALTSAYIVRHAAGQWLEFSIPNYFYWSTGTILLSSITLHTAYRSFVKGNPKMYKLLLPVSFFLGLGFVVLQSYGWTALFEMGVDLKLNVSGSFFYLITFLHALHVLGGIAAILVATLHAYTLPYVVTEKRKTRFQLVCHYWHFVDILWIYLLGFLLFVK